MEINNCKFNISLKECNNRATKCACQKEYINYELDFNCATLSVCGQCLVALQVFLNVFNKSKLNQMNKFIFSIEKKKSYHSNTFYILGIGEIFVLLSNEELTYLYSLIDKTNYKKYTNGEIVLNYDFFRDAYDRILESWESRLLKSEHQKGTLNEDNKLKKKLSNNIRLTKNKTIHLKFSKNNTKFLPLYYCCIRTIDCSVGNHKKNKKGIFILSSNQFDYFDFSFCSNCFYDLLNALMDFCTDEDILLSREGNICITKSDVPKEECFFCGKVDATRYEIEINRKSFILCKDCFIKFCDLIFRSKVTKELFRTKYLEYTASKQQKNEKNQLQKIIPTLFAAPDKTKTYCFYLDKYGNGNINSFTYFPVENVNCNISNHEEPVQAAGILTTNRIHKNLTLAYCKECAKNMCKALKESYEKKAVYRDEENNILIQYYEQPPNSQQCFICGNKSKAFSNIVHANCQFFLCSDCCRKYYNQLLEISRAEDQE